LFEENEWPPPNMETFYFINDGVCYERSDAVIQLSGFLRWPLTMIKWFRFIPKKWRDAYYNLVARNRKRLGTYSCHIPDNDIKSRFLN
jgi:predicted DCC family thiol-disulfide oxidoreductase YuxK